MPQASDELRSRIQARFGSIDIHGPEQFLRNAGYTLTNDWLWKAKPGVVSWNDMSDDEWECMLFLVDEWDYGFLEPRK